MIKFFKNFRNKIAEFKKVPEDYFSVWFADGKITVKDTFDNNENSVDFNNIKKIIINTNDSGPWGNDFIYSISDNRTTIYFPLGCKGEPEILKLLQSIEGFDNQQFTLAVTSTENNSFLVYKK